ncbi:UbiD family decarboxylase [Rhodoplanes sp. TEM]|uniref:UbiD family decarboxylase n=1 Tax=Rhodoplanes tepidamans TaxID=200616 RepID=A0ABT5J633_RHOTP|nr:MULTISPECIES: UbiD family decarboxylase [Rhodoplanes]MDC7785080.1 UbiD family decarboxylase [Rhodoplanes tepidamans]MDC7982554.1 UbiD family decarboxylase [Rhodoplanes sp. TEM]MDQ0356570.1 4-hydroxy-3-polyprenylbenzoate decarboxylase [Rhodoplanes tepidamans]
MREADTLHPALARYLDDAGSARGYPDLHDHLLALHRAGRLVVVDEPINKDTEMHPLVRWQYRGGIPEPERKAFLFTRPTDSNGRRYAGAVLVAGLAANREVYRIGFGRPLEDIGHTWVAAIAAPIPPRVVESAPCHDIVVTGEELDRDGAALDGLPVPISTPGFDNAPYLSAGHYITRDPDTGVQNVGNYRGQLKAPRRLGMNPSVELRAGIYAHWLKYKARGEPMPCAVVVGCPPAVSYASVQKMPEHLDEIAVAGALVGSSINVTRAKTVDLLVPAEAEFVIEGFIATDALEPEAPFGESHGYVNLQEYNAYMEVTAITRRRNPILTSFISQVTPSESSVIRKAAMEPMFLHHLRHGLSIRGVKRVAMHEPLTSLYAVLGIQFERGVPETEVWRALYGASTLHRFAGKWIVAVDEDIDPENADALFWAMSYRCQPQHDLRVLDHKDPGHGPKGPRDGGDTAAVLINAMLKGVFAPVALPRREYMENARAIWERLGLPALAPEAPWHGYELGHWPEALEQQARRAAASDYFKTGTELANQRRSDVAMNSPVAFAQTPEPGPT